MRAAWVGFTFTAGLLAMACGGSGGSAAAPSTAASAAAPPVASAPAEAPAATVVEGELTLSIDDSGFAPAVVTVASGTRITVRNTGTNQHSLISDDVSSFNTFAIDPGEEEVIWAVVPGRYPFHCEFHQAMTGTLTIEE